MAGLKSGLGVQGCQGRAGLLSDSMHFFSTGANGQEGEMSGADEHRELPTIPLELTQPWPAKNRVKEEELLKNQKTQVL